MNRIGSSSAQYFDVPAVPAVATQPAQSSAEEENLAAAHVSPEAVSKAAEERFRQEQQLKSSQLDSRIKDLTKTSVVSPKQDHAVEQVQVAREEQQKVELNPTPLPISLEGRLKDQRAQPFDAEQNERASRIEELHKNLCSIVNEKYGTKIKYDDGDGERIAALAASGINLGELYLLLLAPRPPVGPDQ